MADIYEARIEVLTEENENIRRMLRRLKDTLLYKEKEVESLRGLLKECKNYIPYSFPYLQTDVLEDNPEQKYFLSSAAGERKRGAVVYADDAG